MWLRPRHRALLAPRRVDTDVQRILDATATPATERRTLAAAASDALSADDVLALLDAIEDLVDAQGLDALAGGHRGDLAEFRAVDVAAAINRLRSVELE